MEIGNQYSDTMPVELAKSFIASYKLKLNELQSTRNRKIYS